VSCKITSIEELANTIPVSPPIVNRKTKPNAQSRGVSHMILDPWRVAIQLKTFMPVGTAIIMVAAVK